MQTKIAVIGDRGSVLGFKAVGFDVFEVAGEPSIASLVADLAKQEYGIVFVTEELIAANLDVVEKYKDDMLPAILPIPSRNGSLGIGMENIHKNVERAVGADIFNN
ncbi:V-type ATP synthase subunit F [Anaerovorax odorimutans]|uniref:V-type ATP synthase subunit F n=1 Tax=Anaerovorax odorimutans TaxID=109327 RepID=A0ABT1RNP4_9FIRM|nr:V-type ATP synthase subunit F [Anaerovorax odorimutans]MCQ4636807.1 V-type ATP synthase subunit F [Anaerovorax odorimutans]